MNIKDRSHTRCYDFNQVILTQDDALTQVVKWSDTAQLLEVWSPSWCKCIAKVAYWKTVIEHQDTLDDSVRNEHVAQ